MPEPITVTVFEAKPNTLWPDAMRQVVRFLRFSAAVPCAECGKKRKTHWTMLVPFAAHTMPTHAFVLEESGKVHEPLLPVCRAHPLKPVLPDDAAGAGVAPETPQD